jgi:hypothetical protein
MPRAFISRRRAVRQRGLFLSLIRSNMEYASRGELGGQLVIGSNREVVRPRDGRGLPV